MMQNNEYLGLLSLGAGVLNVIVVKFCRHQGGVMSNVR